MRSCPDTDIDPTFLTEISFFGTVEKIKNERFTVACSRCRQNLRFVQFT